MLPDSFNTSLRLTFPVIKISKTYKIQTCFKKCEKNEGGERKCMMKKSKGRGKEVEGRNKEGILSSHSQICY